MPPQRKKPLPQRKKPLRADVYGEPLDVPRCDGCRFHKPPKNDPRLYAGECRKNPPTVTDEQVGAWPAVRPSDWCGEWRPT
jgi:hypothetical protein